MPAETAADAEAPKPKRKRPPRYIRYKRQIEHLEAGKSQAARRRIAERHRPQSSSASRQVLAQTAIATTHPAGMRHFWMCEVPHTLAWGYRASTRHAGCEMGCNQLMT
jgi:hypothetical protein